MKSECTRKIIQECNTKGFSYQEHKRNLFFEKFSWMLFFKIFEMATYSIF